ncbi:MAG: amino acid adenylation domain-containing protein, partial [bacterium]|nr:amino acid adenylation domain-containing protein [bacterium]
RRTPEHIAILAAAHPAQGRYAVTYRELNEKSNRLAHLLVEKGSGPGSIAAVMTEPSVEMMTGILAVLKTGAGYVPLDPGLPRERITYMLEDSEAKLLLTPLHLLEELEGITGTALPIDINSENLPGADKAVIWTPGAAAGSNPAAAPQQPVYMIYTSGTTGKPKGVIITHQNLVNYAMWFIHQTALTHQDRTILTSSFAFDLGYTSIYPCLLAGGQLHILPKEHYILPGNLLNYTRFQRISYLKVTPSLWDAIVSDANFSKEICKSLRLLVLGGEAIAVRDLEKTYRQFSQISIMNHYGPTEATIGCIAQFVDFKHLETYKHRPTIGRPIFNTRVFILDKYLNLSPLGVVGELCVSGASVGRGYFKREAFTSEKFIANTFIKDEPVVPPYDRLYRTGDLGRWLSDGNIEFLGRIDHQVKIRGFRIEPGEIESRLLNYEGIKETIVVPGDVEDGDRDRDNYLCAYIVPQDIGRFDNASSMA